MERIERIGRRTHGPDPLVPVSPMARVDRRDPDPEREQGQPRKRRPHAAPAHPVEPGHIDVEA
ncbi:MAG TPA: hypothetical protein VIL49_17665 [Capillimicrobium sp.]|jgi:hypothetical protein